VIFNVPGQLNPKAMTLTILPEQDKTHRERVIRVGHLDMRLQRDVACPRRAARPKLPVCLA